ncbi:hypothetical protein DPMN_107140 [Dreissena polymorpha]|uniref:Uncharacterized protein n=1 Tax=Dreissena polymorpha TaxID=45954 RepID=A0A9D4K6I8_DREPO|nr:hypothetical protein DPMN_107140 [Dreissena polymorpha]
MCEVKINLGNKSPILPTYWTKNLTLRMENAPPPGSNVFQPTKIIFELYQDIIGTNPLTIVMKIQTINVACRVKNAPPWWSCFSFFFTHTRTIFELIKDVIGTYVLTKFHKDPTINFAFRVLTRVKSWLIQLTPKNAPPNCSHVFQPTGTIFKLVQDINATNLLTKFH